MRTLAMVMLEFVLFQRVVAIVEGREEVQAGIPTLAMVTLVLALILNQVAAVEEMEENQVLILTSQTREQAACLGEAQRGKWQVGIPTLEVMMQAQIVQ